MNISHFPAPGMSDSITKNKFADRISRRLWYLDAEELIARACRHTGLNHFGEPSIAAALSALTTSLENEADLRPFGRFLMRMHLQGLLETRLRLAQAWQRQATFTLPSVERPVFITGMPRSGSTFLHELLAQDPENRSPKAWEVMFPLPAPEANGTRDARERKAAMNLWWFRRLAPQADAVYPMRANTPHECVAIHSYTFLSEEFVSTSRVPSYEKFLRAEGLRAAYAWERRFLQHLQSRQPTRQWILKSPDHLLTLEDLFAVFPDALIIHTHRNPLEVLESCIEITRVLQGLFGRADTAEHLQREQTRALAERVERSIAFRDRHPELASRFVDVNYSDFVAAPMMTIERIYRHLDRPLPRAAADKMRRLITHRSRYRRRHRSFAELGLDVPSAIGRFKPYCQRFGITCQLPQAG